MAAAQEVRLESNTNKWYSIRTTFQSTRKHRVTWLNGMQGTKKYRTSQYIPAQEIELEPDINNWFLIRTTQKLRIA